MTFRINHLARISRELGELLAVGVPNTRNIGIIVAKIAPMVLDALWDIEHPFVRNVQDLSAFITEQRAMPPQIASQKSRPYNWDQFWFSPAPGSGDSRLRRFWRTQLLLRITAFVDPDGLIDHLKLSKESIQKAATSADESFTRHWSLDQWCHFLHQAIQLLDFPAATILMDSDARTICQGALKIRLSAQEAKMACLLLENQGRPVKYAAFEKIGISYPTRIKSRLVSKCAKAGMTLNISAAATAYTYLP